MRVGRFVVVAVLSVAVLSGCSSHDDDAKALEECTNKAFWDGTDAHDAKIYCKAALRQEKEDEQAKGHASTSAPGPDAAGRTSDPVIPDLVGADLPQARRLLAAMGYAHVTAVDAQDASTEPTGPEWIVLLVDPRVGDHVPIRTTITLTVVRAP